MSQMGRQAPGGWYPHTPKVEAGQIATEQRQRERAAGLYEVANVPSLQPQIGGVGGMLLNAAGESTGQLATGYAMRVLTGPVGVVMSSTVQAGGRAFRQAKAAGATDETAALEQVLVGPAVGLLDALQLEGVLKINNKSAIPAIVKAIRNKAAKEVAKQGVDMTYQQALRFTAAAVTEGLQSYVESGGATIHGQKFDLSQATIQAGLEAVAGGIIESGTGAVIDVATAGPRAIAEVGRQRSIGVAEKAIVQQALSKPSVDEPVEVTSPTPESAPEAPAARETPAPAVGETAIPAPTIPVKPRRRVMGEIGQETTAEPPTSIPEGTPRAPGDTRPYMSARNADMEERAQWMGNPPVPEQLEAGTLESHRQAAIDGGYDQRAWDIVQDILSDPRPATAEETHGMDIRASQLEAEHDALAQRLEALPDDSPERTTITRQMSKLEEQHADLTKVLRWAGTEWSAAGLARQHKLGDNTNVLNTLGRAAKTKGKPLTTDEKAEVRSKVGKLRKKRDTAKRSYERDIRNAARNILRRAQETPEARVARKATDQAKRASRKSAARAVKAAKGLKRYAKMTDAEKDLELQNLLAQDRTDQVIHDIVMNIASRGGDTSLQGLLRRVINQYLPDLSRADITDAIVRASQRKAQAVDETVQALKAIRNKFRTVKNLRTAITDVLYWIEQGRLPDKDIDIRDEDIVISRFREILAQVRRQQRLSEPAEQASLERRIAILEQRLESGDITSKPDVRNYEPSPRTVELRNRAAELNRQLQARRASVEKVSLNRYSAMTDADKDAELQDLMRRQRTDIIVHNIVMNVASRTPGATLEQATNAAMQYLPGMERSDVTESIVNATQQKAKNTDALVQYLRALRSKYRKVKKLRTKISETLQWLENGKVLEAEAGKEDQGPVISRLQDTLDSLRKLYRTSEPAEQARLSRKIEFLKARLAAKDFDSKPNIRRYQPSKRTLQLQYDVARLNQQIAKSIRDMKPVSRKRKAIAESFRTVMALKSSFDLSALGNQGGWVLLSHPVRALRTLPAALRAASSDKRAFEINEAIRNRPNAPYYFRDGLELTQASAATALTDREEEMRSEWAQYIPGVPASNRAFATMLNLLRADSYDAMVDSFADEGGPTEIEGKAIADFINMATGRGNVQGHEKLMHTLNGVFWAPRRAISRFQLLATAGGLLKYDLGTVSVGLRGTRRTRILFAKEMARYLSGLATVYFLGNLAGGELERDPTSSDFGKIRFGDTRLDPLSGMSQTLVFLGRLWYRERKDSAGNIQPLTGYDLERTVTQFLKNKIAPGFTLAWAGISGDTPFDGPTTLWWLLKEAVTPISVDDIFKAMEDQGIPRGTIISMLGMLGIGVQVYGDTDSSGSNWTQRGAL